VKLSQKYSEVSKNLLPGKQEFSHYYFQSEVSAAGEVDDPYFGFPTATRLRSLWPLQFQNFYTSRDFVEAYSEKEERILVGSKDFATNMCNTAVWINGNVRAKMEEHTAPDAIDEAEVKAKTSEAIDCFLSENFSVSHLHRNDLTPTFLLAVDVSGSEVPCCDEHDPGLENPAASDALTKSGYYARLVDPWPGVDSYSSVYVQPAPESGDKPYFKLDLYVSLTSWGYPGCHFDPSYVHPLKTGNRYDLSTGLIQDHSELEVEAKRLGSPIKEVIAAGTVKPKSYLYDFKRTIVKLRFGADHVALGPTELPQLADLIVSHPVPFDALLEVQTGDAKSKGSLHLETTQQAKRAYELEKTTNERPLVDPFGGEALNFETANRKMKATLAAKEKNRWKEITETKANEIMTNAMEGITEKAHKDGILTYWTRLVAWRMPEYLENVGGILLDLEQMGAAQSRLEAVRQELMSKGMMKSTINPTACMNKEGFIYLNELKVLPAQIARTHGFYALVCYGSNMGNNDRVRQTNKTKLESMIALSKSNKPDFATQENKKIISEYLAKLDEEGILVCYYGVDKGLIAKCKASAKQRFASFMQKYGDPNSTVSSTSNVPIMTTTTTMTTVTTTATTTTTATATTTTTTAKNVEQKSWSIDQSCGGEEEKEKEKEEEGEGEEEEEEEELDFSQQLSQMPFQQSSKNSLAHLSNKDLAHQKESDAGKKEKKTSSHNRHSEKKDAGLSTPKSHSGDKRKDRHSETGSPATEERKRPRKS
jgi:hypothetical protein